MLSPATSAATHTRSTCLEPVFILIMPSHYGKLGGHKIYTKQSQDNISDKYMKIKISPGMLLLVYIHIYSAQMADSVLCYVHSWVCGGGDLPPVAV